MKLLPFRSFPVACLLGLSSLLGLLIVSGCDKLDPPEDLPIYLELKGAKVILDPASGFSREVGLKDFWIDHNGFPLGIYRLPRVIPLLPQGEDQVTFSGGIFETGLSSLRARYPFWRPITLNLNAEPLDTIPIELTFEYFPDTILAFPYVENFDGAANTMVSVSVGANRTSLRTSTRDPFQGSGSGLVEFEPNAYNFEAISSDFVALPQTGSNDIYLEITYKNDVAFTAGLLFATFSGGDVGDLNSGLVFLSPDEWNTVYLHVNDQVRGIGASALFKPYLRATSLNASTGEVASGRIEVDNIRLVHFK